MATNRLALFLFLETAVACRAAADPPRRCRAGASDSQDWIACARPGEKDDYFPSYDL